MKSHNNISNISFIFSCILFLSFLVVSFTSCKKEETASRSMMNLNGSITTKGGDTSITLSWPRARFSKNEVIHYTVEVSTNPKFDPSAKDTFSVKVDTEFVTFNDEVLTPKQTYYARVKADAFGLSTMSDWIYSSKFLLTDSVPDFWPLEDRQITNHSVILKWMENPDLTKLVLIDSVSGKTRDSLLSSEAVNDKFLIITGLEPNT